MRNLKDKVKRIIPAGIAVIFWILVWHFCAIRIDSQVFLPSPLDTWKALGRLCKQKEFWVIILHTFGRIAKGFFYAIVVGTIGAVMAFFIKMADVLISPLMKVIKAVPVASFIILALLWVDSSELSVLIAFCMVVPVVYINVLQGCKNVNESMVEMAQVFRMKWWNRIRFIYLPYIFPSFMAACKVGLGYCFKAGIAAEVIGLPAKSIGSELYKSKLYLMTDTLFAWSFVIVLMSIFFEGICIYILNGLGKLAGRINVAGVRRKEEIVQPSILCSVVGDSVGLILSYVNKSYGDKTVLANMNLCLNNRQIICINGVSGEGKTTLLRLIAGIEKPNQGTVTGNEWVSMVFQEDRLIEETDVYSNLYCVLGKDFQKAEVDKHLAAVGLEDMGRTKIKELSGGMKRRVAIVRAILKPSDIVLLDEPFNGLDMGLKSNVMEYVKKNKGNRIMIMVSHNMEEWKQIGGRLIELKDISKS